MLKKVNLYRLLKYKKLATTLKVKRAWSAPSSKPPKRREKLTKEMEKKLKGERYKRSVQDIAANIGRIVNDALQNYMKFVDPPKIIKAVRLVEGLTEDAAKYAIKWLVARPDKA